MKTLNFPATFFDHCLSREFWWVILVIAFLLVEGQSRAAEPEVALPSDWSVGTAVRYEVVRIKENTRGDQFGRGEVRTPLTLEIIERTKAGYRIALGYGRSKVIEPKNLNAAQERMVGIADGLHYVLRTDDAGTPEELVNAAEVSETYRKVLGEIRKTLEESGLPEARIKQSLAMIEPLTRPDRVSATAMKEPNIFFLLTGASFVSRRAVEYDDQLANPLTGKPMATRARMVLKVVDREKGEANLEWSQSPKPGSLPDGVTMTDKSDYIINLKTGWPRRISYERVIASGSTKRVERIVF